MFSTHHHKEVKAKIKTYTFINKLTGSLIHVEAVNLEAARKKLESWVDNPSEWKKEILEEELQKP